MTGDMQPIAIAYANIAKKGKVNLFLSGLIINPVWPGRKVYYMVKEKGLMPFRLLEVKVLKVGSAHFNKVQYLFTNADNQLELKDSYKYYIISPLSIGPVRLEMVWLFSVIILYITVREYF